MNTLLRTKIDTHLHMVYDGNELVLDSRQIADGRTMKAHLEKAGVLHGIILPVSEADLNGMDNITACALAHKYPTTFSWMCNLNADRGEDIEARAAKYKALGAVGVGEFVQNYRIDDPRIDRVLEVCEKLSLPFLFHMSPAEGYNYGIVDDPGLPLLEGALRKYPRLIVVGHSQPFWYEISGDASRESDQRNGYPAQPVVAGGRLPHLFRSYPNLYGDLSANSGGNAIMRDPAFGYAFLEEFQDRLFFATDAMNPTVHFPLAGFLDAAVDSGAISETVYRKVCRENAIRVLGLPVALPVAPPGRGA